MKPAEKVRIDAPTLGAAQSQGGSLGGTAGSLRGHIIKGAGGSLVLQGGFAGLSFLNALILARFLGAKGYGAFANAMAWVSILIIPATFGFYTLLVRDMAIFRSQRKWAEMKGLLRFSNGFVRVLSVLLALIAAVAAYFVFSTPAEATMRLTLWVAAPLVPILALYSLREGATRGLENVIRAGFPGMIIRPGLLFIGVLVIYLFWSRSLSAPVAMGVNVGAGVVTLAAGIFWLERVLPSEVKEASPEFAAHIWLKAAFPMMVYSGMQVVLWMTDIVMLGAMLGAEEAGLFAAANRLAYLLLYVTVAIEVIMAPIMSRLYDSGEKDRLQSIITKTVRVAFIIILPFGLILVLGGDYVLAVFGQDFIAAQGVLIILAVATMIVVAAGSGRLLLGMTGHEKTVAFVLSAASLANLVLNVLLIPKFGLEGAAYATAFSLVGAQILLSTYALARMDMNVTIIRKWPGRLSVERNQ